MCNLKLSRPTLLVHWFLRVTSVMFHHEHVGRRHAPIPYPVIEMNEAGQKSWWAGGTKGTDASETLEKTLCAVGSDGLSASSFSTPQAMYMYVVVTMVPRFQGGQDFRNGICD